MHSPNTLHIGFGFDAAYVRPVGVSLTSIAGNNSNTSIHAHLFNSSLAEEDLLKFEALVKQYPNLKIDLYHVNEKVINMLPIQQYLPLAIYFRLTMPLVLPDIARLLYLDSDVLCLGNLSEIAKIDMDCKTVLVVSDVSHIANKRIEALALKSGKYFNSGVMMIDIKKWNKQKASERAFSMLCNSSTKFRYFDQDVLNLILEDNSKYIDKKWNFIRGKDTLPPNINLLHCTAHPKPWKILCNSQTQSLFLHYENLSPWKGTALEYPTTYTEARQYSKHLFKNKFFKDSFVWYKKYLSMKINCKMESLNNITAINSRRY
jgi:Lipopolysaccharide biosynthesis proteins, LPS:glycosyltransferases